MRRMIVLILCLTITTLWAADKVSVRGVELLEGDHVVQIRFVTSEAIPPIPDVSEKDGNRLVLFSPDLSFQLNQPEYRFESPQVKTVRISEAGAEIELHAKTQYRLFSNGDGLFVEFPKTQSEPVQLVNMKPEAQPEPEATQKPAGELQVMVQSSGQDSVQLLINVPQKTRFEVIPIEREPYRLAIDLQGVRAKALKEEIERFNVHKVRGAPNTPEVYRVVFDLAFLSQYRVDPVEGGLLIEFYRHEQPAAALALAAGTELEKPAAAEPAPVAAVAAVDSAFFMEEAALADPSPQENAAAATDPVSPHGYSKSTIAEGTASYKGEPYDFVFKNADLLNVLKDIAKLAEINIVVDPGVSGKVTSELVQVPWDQALEIFLKQNKLGMVIDGNIMRIGKVEDLAKEAEQLRKLQEARDMEGKLEVITRPLSYAKATQVAKLLEKQLSKRGEIQVDERSNSMIISEVPDRVKILDRLIETIDVANQQVSIEARIVESNHTDANAFGINWGVSGVMSSKYGNQTTLKFPNSIEAKSGLDNGYAINLPISGNNAPNTALGLSFGNIAGTFGLDVMLQAMESKGQIRILSSPRTTTQNNMEAELINGRKIPIQTQQPNGTYTVTYVNAALELKVKPQITAEGTIITEVDIKNDAADFSQQVLGSPTINTQSAKNTIMVKDGGTIVIGGLYRIESNDTKQSVPLLGKIPLLGNLFRNNAKYTAKRELLIFITPRIVK